MKRTAAIAVLLVLSGVWAGLAYQVAASRERSYRRLLRAGDAALQQDQTFAAIEAFGNALYLRPDSTLAHLRRGETYRRRGDLDAAIRDFQSAADIDPSSTRPLEAIGDVRYAQERFSGAAASYERVLALDDRVVGVTRKLALARYRNGNPDGAIAALAQTAKFGALLPGDHYLRGICLREQGKLRDAAAAFAQALELSPALIPAHEELAAVDATLGRRTDEIEQLQLLAVLDHQRPEREAALGLAEARAGHVERAVDILRAGLERTPDRAQLYGAIGRVWLESSQARGDSGALRKALQALQGVASAPGATSELLVLYGRALAIDGQIESAERTLLLATARFPVDPAAFAEHAAIAERRGHFEDAKASWIRYGALTTDELGLATRARRLGQLSLRLNQPGEAVRWLRQAEAFSPDDASLLAQLAGALLLAGDRDAARTIALRGLDRDPTSVPFRSVEIRTRK